MASLNSRRSSISTLTSMSSDEIEGIVNSTSTTRDVSTTGCSSLDNGKKISAVSSSSSLSSMSSDEIEVILNSPGTTQDVTMTDYSPPESDKQIPTVPSTSSSAPPTWDDIERILDNLGNVRTAPPQAKRGGEQANDSSDDDTRGNPWFPYVHVTEQDVDMDLDSDDTLDASSEDKTPSPANADDGSPMTLEVAPVNPFSTDNEDEDEDEHEIDEGNLFTPPNLHPHPQGALPTQTSTPCTECENFAMDIAHMRALHQLSTPEYVVTEQMFADHLCDHGAPALVSQGFGPPRNSASSHVAQAGHVGCGVDDNED